LRWLTSREAVAASKSNATLPGGMATVQNKPVGKSMTPGLKS